MHNNLVLLYLSFIKNYFDALLDSKVWEKESYSQNSEDVYVLDILRSYDNTKSLYIDVGANHPTKLSNTFLFYKNGYKGIVIDPNYYLIKLYKLFRTNDITLNIGVGDRAAIEEYYFSSGHTRNSFGTNITDIKNLKLSINKKEYFPLLTIDQIMMSFPDKWVSFLSIDTEGMDLTVLEGAKFTLKKTLLVCVEANSVHEEELLEAKLSESFILKKKIGCNLIFQNRNSIYFNNYFLIEN